MSEFAKPDLVIPKPPVVRKPRKGDCGTCHWFERVPAEPKAGNPWSGYCNYNPPIAAQTAVPQMGAQGMQMQAMWQGVCPPVSELGRCHHWIGARQYFDSEENHGTAAA